MPLSDYLAEKWQETLNISGLEVTANKQAERLLEDIIAAHSEAHRHYHTLRHLEEVFQVLEATEIPLCEEIAWSIWYHDIVYRPGKSDNESKSADIARDRLTQLGVDAQTIESITTFIIASKHHKTDDATCQLFLDADMAILGAEKSRYQEYVEQVNAEFSSVPQFLYKRGRKKFIKTVLAEEAIFKHPAMHAKLEQRAKENLHWELQHI